jgi:hypothetical protein
MSFFNQGSSCVFASSAWHLVSRLAKKRPIICHLNIFALTPQKGFFISDLERQVMQCFDFLLLYIFYTSRTAFKQPSFSGLFVISE